MRSFGFSAFTCLMRSMPLGPGIDMSSSSTSKSVRAPAAATSCPSPPRRRRPGRRGREDALQAVAHDRVVVGDEDADHGGALPAAPGSRTASAGALRGAGRPSSAPPRRATRSRTPFRPSEPALRGSCARCRGRRPRSRVKLRRLARHATPDVRGARVARDVGERLLHDRGRPRWRRRCRARGRGSPNGNSHGTPERCAKFSTSHSAASAEAEVVQHQRAQVGGDAPRGADGRSSSADMPSGARRARARRAGRRSRSQARSILSAVSSCPSSSCSSRAMRVFSSSRASCTRAESSRSSCCDRVQRILDLLAPRDVAQDHGDRSLPRLAALRDRRVDRELGAVGTQRPTWCVAHAPAGDAGAAELLAVRVVRGAEALRDEALQRPPIASSRRTPNIARRPR